MSGLMLFGSAAIRSYFPLFREPNDLDYMVDPERVEFLRDCSRTRRNDPENPFKNAKWEYYPLVPGLEMKRIIDITDQYTLTLSHMIRKQDGVNWNKHLYTIRFLKENGCVYDRAKFDKFTEFWDQQFGKRRIPDFDQPNDEFFKDRVKRKMNHDELHQHFSFYEKPLFTQLKFDQTRAKTEEVLFNKLSFEDQIKTVLEEIFTICAERLIDENYKLAFNKILRMLVFISPEWFSLFILDNYNLLHQYSYLWKIKSEEFLLKNPEYQELN